MNKKKAMSKVFIDDKQRLKEWLINADRRRNFYEYPIEDNNLEIEKMTYLGLNDRKNMEIPTYISLLSNLKTLNLSNMNLEKLPDSIIKLNKLEKLLCKYNKLKEFPKGFERMNLTYLDIEHNSFKVLDESFSEMVSLKELYLKNNFFDSLPDCVYNLPSLEILSIDNDMFIGNKLKSVKFISSPFMGSNTTDGLKDLFSEIRNNGLFNIKNTVRIIYMNTHLFSTYFLLFILLILLFILFIFFIVIWIAALSSVYNYYYQ